MGSIIINYKVKLLTKQYFHQKRTNLKNINGIYKNKTD